VGPINYGKIQDGTRKGPYPTKGSISERTRGGVGGVLKPKDLCMIPNRLAIALQDDGWWVRSEIIWHKPNPMPESVTDRPATAHEKIWLLSKSARYYYDAEAVRRAIAPGSVDRYAQDIDSQEGSHRANGGTKSNGAMRAVGEPSGANLRNVWTIPTKGFSGAHYATFPPDLIVPCIKAGCPKGGTVLDPFIGSGTTAVVADRLGRNCIGIDLNPANVEMATDRVAQDAGMFAEVSA
ncbi:MAG: DNA-methyltransferase, partial [Geminicoccaceae bacterium]